MKSLLEIAREGRELAAARPANGEYVLFVIEYFPALAQALEDAVRLLRVVRDSGTDDEIQNLDADVRAFLARVAPTEQSGEGD